MTTESVSQVGTGAAGGFQAADPFSITWTATDPDGFSAGDILFCDVLSISTGGPTNSSPDDDNGYSWNVQFGKSLVSPITHLMSRPVYSDEEGDTTIVSSFEFGEGFTGPCVIVQALVLRGLVWGEQFSGSSDTTASTSGVSPRSSTHSMASRTVTSVRDLVVRSSAGGTAGAGKSTTATSGTTGGDQISSAANTAITWSGTTQYGAGASLDVYEVAGAYSPSQTATMTWTGGGNATLQHFTYEELWGRSQTPTSATLSASATATVGQAQAFTDAVDPSFTSSYDLFYMLDWGDGGVTYGVTNNANDKPFWASTVSPFNTGETDNPLHTYAANGVYTLTCTYYSIYGTDRLSTTVQTTVTITSRPGVPHANYLTRVFHRSDLPFDLRTIRLGGE